MIAMEAIQTVPFEQWADGSLRLTGTRVHLYLILHHYKQGVSAEEINRRLPAVSLEKALAVIAYYLSHQSELDAYLQQQEEAEAVFMRQLEADPKYQAERVALRERLTMRREEMRKNHE